MDITKAEQKQIENEMIFRRKNEKVSEDLEVLDDMHEEDGDHDLNSKEDMLLTFKCECSDENCEGRIPLQLDRYKKIHNDRSTFILKHGHQVDLIEEVISKEVDFTIVRKKKSVPEPGDKLNKTAVDNS